MKKQLLFFTAALFTVSIATAQTFTFTNCGNTGYSGPSQAEINSTYGSTNNLYGDVTVTSGIQYWTVPATGSYSIEVHGAEGGQSNNYGGSGSGGDGAMMSGDFTLTAGTQLKILVGQQGTADSYDGGGGGGTFVTLTDNTPLIIAGGGGGGSSSNINDNHQQGWINENGQTNSNGTSGGTNGSGGGNCTTAGGGGGLLTNGSGSWPGTSFVNGGNGHSSSAYGGFGCGGSGGGTSGAGGGGGYSGGAGSCWSQYGGGGGSYNSGSNQLNETGENTGHGFVVIYAPPCAYSTSNVSLEIGTNSYSWNGTTYNEGGTYTDTLSAAAGCDSVATLNLTIPTGNGIVAHINDSYNFTPTTVDSTTTISVQFNNTINATSTVSLSELGAPFSVSSTSFEIPANDSTIINFSFNPNEVGFYTETLIFTGSIFGGGEITLSGEGIQPNIEVGTDTINLAQVALGNLVSEDVWVYNTGTGNMVVSDITSNASTITVSPTSFSVAEGDSAVVSVTFTPVLAGDMSTTLTIFSNDPNSSTYTVSVIGNAISNISGNMCATLLAINSPYSLVGDIIVPDSCTLTIEPGVVLNGNGYNFYSTGTVNAVGTQSDSIFLNNMAQIKLMNSNSSDNLEYINIAQAGPLLYVDDFEVNNYTTVWTYSSNFDRSTSYGRQGNGVRMYSTDGNDTEYITGPFISNSKLLSFSWDYKDISNETDCSVEFYYRINSESWELLLMDETLTADWVTVNKGASEEITIGDEIEFKVVCNTYSSNSSMDDLNIYFDNFKINDSKLNLRQENDLNISNSTISSDVITTEFIGNLEITDFEGSTTLPTGWTYSEDSSTPGWSISTSYGTNTTNGIFMNGYDYDSRIFSPIYVCDGVFNVTYDYRKYSTFENYCYARFYYQINDGAWVMFAEYDYQSSTEWATYSNSIPATLGDNVQLKFESDVFSTSSNQDEARFNLDNIIIELYTAYGENSILSFSNCIINSDFNLNKILDIDSSSITCIESGLFNSRSVTFNNSILNSSVGITTNGNDANVSLYNSTIQNCLSDGISTLGPNSEVSLQYSFVKDNGGVGISTLGTGSHVNLTSSMVTGNGSYGIKAAGQVNLDYSNITFNEDDGIYLTGNNFSNIKNSIIWGNDIVSYTQINTSSGVTSISYSTVQGSGAYGTSGSQYYYGDGSIDDDPVFENDEQHMSSFSNCVDAGTPWESDSNMPYGLGGVRADIGIYGGPNNWFWGGTAVPDGATIITSVEDKPQDQGGSVGVIFDASVWDNSTLVNNVTSYAVWRHFDPMGLAIDSVSAGNWELVEEMPAQSFSSYAITSESLGDSTLTNGPFNTCFVVVANTADSDVFWYSNVACGYSTDDIAPLMPDGMEGRYAYNGGLSINWNYPQESDYLKSLIYRDGVFVGISTSSEFFDDTAIEGSVYSYTVEHLDAAGNASEYAEIEVSSLLPNWELASSERTHHIAIPEDFTISTSNDLVDRGDFLGVFYTDNETLVCGGMVQWSEEDIVLTAFGTSEDLQGFATNEEFVWRYWDASKNEYYLADVTYNSSLPNSANFIEDGLSALQSIHIYAKQEIELPQGWSMISSYVMEDNLLLSSLMAPVNEDIFIMKDDNGTVYWPAYNFNEIGDLSDEKGYKLLMNQSNEISFSGRKVIPNETVLNLNQGWQIIPYLRENPASVEALLESVSESIVIVKDNMGNVYWPDWEVNTIGNFMPGKAYQIKMVNDRNYNYPANATVMPLEQRLGDFEPEYFIVQNRTESNMTLGIPVDAWEVSPNVLDEIAVCDAQDRIVGSAVFMGEDLVMSIWANDEYGTSKTGLLEGESFHVKYRDMSTNTTYSLKVTAWQQGSSQFQEDEIAIVSWVEQGGIIDQDFHIYPVIPNPSTHVAQLQFFSPGLNEVSIKMFNILGELVLKESLSVEEGIHQFEIPSYLLNNGTYTIKVETTDRVDVQSIQIIR